MEYGINRYTNETKRLLKVIISVPRLSIFSVICASPARVTFQDSQKKQCLSMRNLGFTV